MNLPLKLSMKKVNVKLHIKCSIEDLKVVTLHVLSDAAAVT